MPQIGWFEILVVVVLAILVIGPKDFPIVVKKIGGIVGSMKRYFYDFQKDVTNIQESIEDEISVDREEHKEKNQKNNNES